MPITGKVDRFKKLPIVSAIFLGFVFSSGKIKKRSYETVHKSSTYQ